MAGLDKRRRDQRDCILRNPFWLSSAMFDYNDASDEIVLFDFPAVSGDKQVLVMECVIEIITAFAGTSPVIDIGSGTIATAAFVTGDTVTTVDANEYIPQADITAGTAGYYWAATGDWLTAKAAGTGAVRYIVCADATVPVVYATIGGSSLTAGQAVVHMLATLCPFSLD